MTASEHYAAVLGTVGDMVTHMPRLRHLVVEIGARQVIELGVRGGVSTVALLAGLEETGGSLWSCDIRGVDVPRDLLEHPAWTLYQGDDVSAGALDAAPGSCDLLFVDTSHTRAHTTAELAEYGRRVRSGGYVVCHDTALPGVAGPLWRFHREHGAELTDDPRSFGLGIVRVR